MTREVPVGNVIFGGGRPFVFIGGPCVIESRDSSLRHAEKLREVTDRAGVPFIFKSSYDKANRTSKDAFRGSGIDEGLSILAEVRRRFDVPVLTDVHEKEDVAAVAAVVDVLQTPAFLCRQTDYLLAVAGAGKPVNVKKGQFLAPWDMGPVIEKLKSTGNPSILVTERGFSFGYNNLVADMRSLAVLADFGCPVIYDAGHSVQLPGGQGTASGGQRQFIRVLARAAVAVGLDGVFLEVHEDPDHARSDGPNSYRLDQLEDLLKELREIDAIVKRH